VCGAAQARPEVPGTLTGGHPFFNPLVDNGAGLAYGPFSTDKLNKEVVVGEQQLSRIFSALADAGLVSQTKDAQRRPCHLEAEVFT